MQRFSIGSRLLRRWMILVAVFVNVSAQGDSDSIGCRIKIDDVVKDDANGQHPERLHLLPGQVRMSTHQAERQSTTDRVADAIRRFSVLIAFFWLGLAVVTNVFVPQLETVAQAHNVSLSPQDAPSLQASKRIGKVFQRVRFRQCGDDRPGGRPAARCRRAPLLRRLD